MLTQNNICSIAIKDFVCQEITVKLQLYRLNKYYELCTLLEKIIAVLKFVQHSFYMCLKFNFVNLYATDMK